MRDVAINWVTSHAKAVVAALVAFLGALQVGMAGGLSAQEAVGAAVGGLVALGGVYGVANAGQAAPQAVVDAVKRELPEDVGHLIDAAVAPVGRGVLRSVVGDGGSGLGSLLGTKPDNPQDP